MNVNDYGKYNFADMLISIEEEMENHITALRTARKQIGLLWNYGTTAIVCQTEYAILSLFLICIILTIAEMMRLREAAVCGFSALTKPFIIKAVPSLALLILYFYTISDTPATICFLRTD